MRTFVNGKETAEMLRAKGVLVRAEYPGFEKHIRVSLGLPDEMRVFLEPLGRDDAASSDVSASRPAESSTR